MKRSTNSAKIGAQGEDFVLECLKESFPSYLGYRIYRQKQTGCGDIVLYLPNNQAIMIEVKDYVNVSSVKSHKGGNEIKKFYSDSISTKLGFKFSGKDLCFITPYFKQNKIEGTVELGNKELFGCPRIVL